MSIVYSFTLRVLAGPAYVPTGWLEYLYFSIHLFIFLISLIGKIST